MRFALFPLVVAMFLASHFSLAHLRSKSHATSYPELSATQGGQIFVSYRDAVMTYMANNPNFIGSVSKGQLKAQGFLFEFRGPAGNDVTATASGGRVVTVYADLPLGALSSAAITSGHDASLGTSEGATWKSIGPGSSPQALATGVQSGYVVSVNQIGK